MSQKDAYIIEKYHDIITEELNVKQLTSIDETIVVTKIYKPLGNKLSAKYGKDTGKIIQLGKEGNAKALPNGQLVIFDEENNERIIEQDEYDIEYQGLDTTSMAADTGIVVQYDLHITPELEQEWIAREISRFLNQMRKDAGFSVEKKAICHYSTGDVALQETMIVWEEFLIQEALLSEIREQQNPKGTHTDIFTLDEWSIVFALTSM
jgi:isoleucyl-tRNA synthetase